MRRFKLAIAALFLMLTAIVPATAQSDMIDGTVTKVDQSAGKITIKHGPIKKFDMDERMSMVFRAEKLELLNGLKAGDKIRFAPDRINGQFTVTRIEKATQK
jgi:Cu/Ag efflux protein CusF